MAAENEKTQLEQLVLSAINSNGSIADTSAWLEQQHKSGQREMLVGVLKSLESDNYVTSTPIESKEWRATAEAQSYVEKGSPEAQLFNAIPKEGLTLADAEAKLTSAVVKVAMGTAVKSKWIVAKKDGANTVLTRIVDSIQDTVRQQLSNLASLDAATLEGLKKRKLVEQIKIVSYTVNKGPKFALQRAKKATDIDEQMLTSGSWRTTEFKPYNLKARGVDISTGALHPLMKIRAHFRSVLLQMGFEEMPTNNFVESSFWNFDALFQPQQHPARDSHDTFFLTAPSTALQIPEDYKVRVQKVHEQGGYDSIGYRYKWSLDEAKKNILRTHTTAVSTRMLYQLAQNKPFTPKKYFSIDRVFRNEAIDFTHLAEFHQVEGLVADRNLTLGDLIGVIKTFFEQIGITDVKFKPAYNPYTEPSMEIFGFSKELNKYIEIGNSGMFRPEMLLPMGLPEDVRVIAWGLSLERPTMIKYGIKNIRDLFGHKVKLNVVQRNPVPRYDLPAAPEQQKAQ